MAWFAVGTAVVSAGTSIYSATQQSKAAKKAVASQKELLNSLKYEPIDIEKLKADATKSAVENATASLALERSLQPDVANTRSELARQVNADLALGGELSADVSNRVNAAGRVIGARSGIGSGSTTPLTASLLGLSSIDLINQRRGAANSLLAANPLPVTGLDPGQIASTEIAQNAAQNEFNLAKSGVESNLIDSEAAARSAQIGGQVGMVSSLANLIGTGAGAMGGGGQSSNIGNLLAKTNTKSTNQNPSTNLYMGNSALGLA